MLDRKEFAEQMGKEHYLNCNENEILDAFQQSLDINQDRGIKEGQYNLIITLEELNELAKEITKVLRGKGNQISILEELADVIVCLGYVQKIIGVTDDDIAKAVLVKGSRLIELEEEEKYE